MSRASQEAHRESPLRLRRAFVAVTAALLIAVGVSALAGGLGVGLLQRTVAEVVEGDARRLLVATHVRRLFRSELVVEQRARGGASGAPRAVLDARQEEIRRERAVRLAELEELLLPEQRGDFLVLRQQHELVGDLLTRSEQPWEQAIATILASTEQHLAATKARSERAYRGAMTLLLSASLLSATLGIGLGAIALRRIRRASDQLWANEERLRHAQRLESIGRVAGGIAHDFNNLLTVIRGHASLLEQDLGHRGVGCEDVGAILSTVDRAAGLTRQLLAFSRRQTVTCQVLDLGKLLGGMQGLLARMLGSAATLDLRVGDEPSYSSLDPTQVEQILMNLTLNAAQAMPGGGTLSVTVDHVELAAGELPSEPTLRPGSYVRLTVADTGAGMSLEVQRRAFEPFFTTKRVGEGTGLGLSVVHGAVRQLGGAICLTSTEGVGTTFHIYWPRVEDPAPEVTHTVSGIGRRGEALTSSRAMGDSD